MQLLLAADGIDAEAKDAAGQTALSRVLATADEGGGDAARQMALAEVAKLLSEANMVVRVRSQVRKDISAEDGLKLRALMMKLVPPGGVSGFSPKVMLSFASGHRVGDGPGVGPGNLMAHLLASSLDREGTACFSCLHPSPGLPLADIRTMWYSKVRKADVVLAVLTPSFYASSSCLEEMTAALAAGAKIFPLVFELTEDGKGPWEEGAWTQTVTKLEASKDKAALATAKATIRALAELAPEPAPPATLLDDSELVEGVLAEVKAHLAACTAAAADDAAAAAAAAAPSEREQIAGLKKELARTLRRAESSERDLLQAVSRPTTAAVASRPATAPINEGGDEGGEDGVVAALRAELEAVKRERDALKAKVVSSPRRGSRGGRVAPS